MNKVIMHLDMDAFFAAVEQRDNPELRGRPLVVGALPGGRGVVSTCSYEARKFGIHSAMPIAIAHRLCPHAVFLRPSFGRYAADSKRVMELLGTISPVVEQVSIDEAFLDATGLGRLLGTPEKIARKAKGLIWSELELTASMGVGPNRAIAKIASDMEKPDGLTIVAPDEVERFLADLDVSVLRGVGAQTIAALNRLGIRKVRDLRKWKLAELRNYFGKRGGIALYRKARGIASDRVGGAEPRKQISKENTFGQDLDDFEELKSKMLELACDVGRSARGQGVRGRVVRVKVRTEGFETHTIQKKLDRATSSDLDIFDIGWGLYRASPYTGRPVRLIGIGIADLEGDNEGAGGLFAAPSDSRKKQMYKVLDSITDRHGGGAIGFGGPGKKKKD